MKSNEHEIAILTTHQHVLMGGLATENASWLLTVLKLTFISNLSCSYNVLFLTLNRCFVLRICIVLFLLLTDFVVHQLVHADGSCMNIAVICVCDSVFLLAR